MVQLCSFGSSSFRRVVQIINQGCRWVWSFLELENPPQVRSYGCQQPSFLHLLLARGFICLPCRLPYRVACSMAPAFPQSTKRSVRENLRQKLQVLYKLISDLVCHHFCCMPWTTQTNPGTVYKGVNTQQQELMGLSWKPTATVDIQLPIRKQILSSTFVFVLCCI